MFCAIWYHLYSLKNVKNTHVGYTFQKYGKQDSFGHIRNKSVDMYESSSSTFFTEIQPGPGAFDKRFAIILPTNLGVKEYFIFRLGLEDTGKDIPKASRLAFLKKFLTIFFYMIRQTTPPGPKSEKV